MTARSALGWSAEYGVPASRLVIMIERLEELVGRRDALRRRGIAATQQKVAAARRLGELVARGAPESERAAEREHMATAAATERAAYAQITHLDEQARIVERDLADARRTAVARLDSPLTS